MSLKVCHALIWGLRNYAVSSSDYMASNDSVIFFNNGLGRKLNEAVVA
jgi:hypothetical protein